jgi:hypothetical protein
MRRITRPGRPRPRPQREELKTIFGCYHWNSDRTDYDPARDGNLLRWGQETVARIGAPMIRVYFGVRDGYELGVSPESRLIDIATHPAWRQLFADPRLSDYLLTTYSHVCDTHQWADDLSPAETLRVVREFFELARHLATEYPQKRFVILNWEADNALPPILSVNPGAAQDMADWISARVEGVRLAGAPNVRCGFEITRVLPGADYYTLDEVIPRMSVRPDCLSLSAWEVFNPRFTDEIEHDRWPQAQQILAAHGWRANETIIGELGFYDRQHGAEMAARRLDFALRQLTGRVAYIAYWQSRDSQSGDGDGLVSFEGEASTKLDFFRQAVAESNVLTD